MCTVTKGRQVTEANPNLVRWTIPVQSLYSPCTVPVQSRLQSRLRKLVTKPSSLCSRGNIKIDGYLDSKESTGTVDFPHKSQPGLYRDCTGTVPGLYRDCNASDQDSAGPRIPSPSYLCEDTVLRMLCYSGNEFKPSLS